MQGWQYHEIRPNAQGQLLSQTTGILVGLTGANKREVELIDRVTGKRLLSNEEEKVARLEAEIRAESEAQRAETEAQRANQAESNMHQSIQNMLSEGFSLEIVSRLTGLTIDEIRNRDNRD